MSQVQFYRGVVIIAGNVYPMLPGARLTCPKNYSVPPLLGNRWQLNFMEGARQPTIDCSFEILDTTTGVMGTTFLNYFLTRTNDYADDTTNIGDIVFYNGYTRITMKNCKADSFSIGSSKGDDLRFNARFCGSSIDISSNAGLSGVSPSYSAFGRPPILRFQSVTFSNGPFPNNVWNFNLSYSNNHTPNNALNGTSFPVEMNAGMQSVAFSAMVQANNQFVDNGIDWLGPGNYGNIETVDQLGVGSFSAIQPITFVIQGLNITRTITLNNPVDNSPDERSVSMPRVLTSHSYICLGLDNVNTPPMVIS